MRSVGRRDAGRPRDVEWARGRIGRHHGRRGRRGDQEDHREELMTHRVVVTGWGVLSSIGHDAATYWDNLKRGVCGIAPAVTIPTEQLTQKVVAEVKDYDPLKHFDERIA